ncbi:MAG: chromosomal replication initiation protein DnaA [Deltaproteobacteria bacterium RIFCSPHIGHO2_12_FULL_43_9]|nr:MAG: chromosomal replication initiation protein DnaA [Deltaproteobacteria bacterium RIFCSPHIGHO2_12_FULL_43_9]
MAQDIWIKALAGIKQRINDQGFKTWIDPLKALRLEGDEIEISVPNVFFVEWINEQYLDILKEEIARIINRNLEIRFLVEDVVPLQNNLLKKAIEKNEKLEARENSGGVKTSEITPPALKPYGEQLNPKYSFDNFVVGSSNQFAHAAAYCVAEQPGNTYNPLFIFGGVGLGKTHLLNAIGSQILRKNPRTRIFYLPAEKFANELINSIRYEKMEQFRGKYRDHLDVLLMDDIQFIAGKERTMEEFFHTFNSLYGSRKQIVVTSDKFPKDIQGLEERLQTRFGWGLIADIQPPEMETRLAILKTKAELEDIYLPEDVAMFLASHIKSNIRELEGSLIRIGAFSSLTGMEISVDLAKEVLNKILQEEGEEITVEGIQKAVSAHFDIKLIDLKSQKKLKILSLPRQIAMFLTRKYTKKSFPDIGKAFGGKDHSTVIHAVNKIEASLKEDLLIKQHVDAIARRIGK